MDGLLAVGESGVLICGSCLLASRSDEDQHAIAAIDVADRELDLALTEKPAGSKPRAAKQPQTGRKKRTRGAKKTAPAKRRQKKR